MQNLILTYLPTEGSRQIDGPFVFGNAPLHTIDNGDIVGVTNFRYTSQPSITKDGIPVYFNKLELTYSFDNYNPNKNEVNALTSTIYFESFKQNEFISPGQTYKGKLTSSTLDISPDATVSISVEESTLRRFVNLIF